MRQLKRMPLAVANTIDQPTAPATVLPRLRMGKLCISVQGATPAELISRAESAIKDSVFIEFRLDYLPKPPAVLPDIKALLIRRRDVTAIATCRRKPYGGKFTGSLNSELEILLKAAETGCHIVDLEVDSADQCTRPQLAKFRAALRAAGS